MSQQKKRGGGRGRGGDSRPSGEYKTRAGAGRGIPDYKDKDYSVGRRAGSSQVTVTPEPDSGRFNAEEAQIWLQNRHKTVMETIEAIKKEGGPRAAEVQYFGGENVNLWSASKPILPSNADFLYQVMQAQLKDPAAVQSQSQSQSLTP